MADNKKPRKPRAPRVQSARKGTAASNASGKANRAIRARLVALESRMVLLERLVWSHHDVVSLDLADQVLTEVHSEEE